MESPANPWLRLSASGLATMMPKACLNWDIHKCLASFWSPEKPIPFSTRPVQQPRLPVDEQNALREVPLPGRQRICEVGIPCEARGHTGQTTPPPPPLLHSCSSKESKPKVCTCLLKNKGNGRETAMFDQPHRVELPTANPPLAACSAASFLSHSW